MKIVSAAEMRAIDRATSEQFAVPSLMLMENAGSAVARFILDDYPRAERIGVICGKGNNGGDGFVAARKLAEAGRSVRVLLLCDPAELRGDAAAMFAKMTPGKMAPARTASSRTSSAMPSSASTPGATPSKVSPIAFASMKLSPLIARDPADLDSPAASEIFASDLIVDAVLGTGFRPPVSDLYAAAIRKMNASPAPIVAVDIPSGADADANPVADAAAADSHSRAGHAPSAAQSSKRNATKSEVPTRARADAIVTFTAPRPAHVFSALTTGPTIIAPIGSPPEAIASELALNLSTPADFADLLAPRALAANKGSYGHVLVIGGSLGKAGAAAMAGFSALRAGAGLATVATAKSVLPTVAGFHPELMTEPLPETPAGTIGLRALESLGPLLERKTVIAIGPGISRDPETSEFVRALLKSGTLPASVAIVIDADALNAFEGASAQLNGRGRTLVITPHPGEMSRLNGLTIPDIQSRRLEVARDFAREHELIVVLKGHRTLIAAPDGTIWVNPTGNPGMATGGTGDILTGMVAGIIAQHPHDPLKATALAVYLHGLAGDQAKDIVGENSLVATDLVRFLPQAFGAAKQAHVAFRMHA
ncbi:MAG: NAD(P)H-hydrate dehydratase [Terriglobales bacterium]|jgi:NAD(P)H-hydrate epimerase